MGGGEVGCGCLVLECLSAHPVAGCCTASAERIVDYGTEAGAALLRRADGSLVERVG